MKWLQWLFRDDTLSSVLTDVEDRTTRLERRVAELERQLKTRELTDREILDFQRAFGAGKRRINKENPWKWDEVEGV